MVSLKASSPLSVSYPSFFLFSLYTYCGIKSTESFCFQVTEVKITNILQFPQAYTSYYTWLVHKLLTTKLTFQTLLNILQN